MAIDLLWTCFYFNACHPLPRRDVYDGTIEWPAFQRPVAFLAGQGIEIQSFLKHGGCSWNHDAMFTRAANFSRVLRSISHPKDPGDCTTNTPTSASAVKVV